MVLGRIPLGVQALLRLVFLPTSEVSVGLAKTAGPPFTGFLVRLGPNLFLV
jgi:hypothetical protein